MLKSSNKLFIAIVLAAALWFFMFSPWTAGLLNFWLEMTISACTLTAMAFFWGDCSWKKCSGGSFLERPAGQILLGVALAFALWGIFWIGDKLSSAWFGFARPQVDAVYSMKQGLPGWAIALLLLLVIGPAEEFFWRGFVQDKMARMLASWRFSADHAFLITTLIYGLVHIWSFNFMLVMAALVAGAVWGFVYRLNSRLLPALVLSHALWDAIVFVLLPI